jgi:peptidoglycan/LPS O-acetylase OafA/YrhL
MRQQMNDKHIQSNRIFAIDYYRGIAILWVMAFHTLGFVYGRYSLLYTNGWADLSSVSNDSYFIFYPLSFGWAGVRLFYVISGFSIHWAVLRHGLPEKLGWKPFLKNYSIKRLLRIYPPYLVAMALFIWLQWPYWKSIILHLLMLHNLQGDTFFNINASFWSLAVELQFYAMYPLLLLARSRWGIIKTLKGLMALTGLLYMLSFVLDSDLQSNVIWESAPLHFIEWTLGMLLAEWYSQGALPIKISGKQCWGAALLLVGLSWNLYANQLTGLIAGLLGFLLLAKALGGRITENRISKAVRQVGIVSYSLYLLHQPLIPYFYRWYHHIVPVNKPLDVLLGFPLFLGVMLVFGWIGYVLVEKPAIAAANKLLGKKKA